MSEETQSQKSFNAELFAAILIGIATVLGAWVAYQASLWGGSSSDYINKGMNTIGQANNAYTEASQRYAYDMTTYMQYSSLTLQDQQLSKTEIAEMIRKKVMNEDLRTALSWSKQVNDSTYAAMMAITQEEVDQIYAACGNDDERFNDSIVAVVDAIMENQKYYATERVYKNPEPVKRTLDNLDEVAPNDSDIYWSKLYSSPNATYYLGRKYMELGQDEGGKGDDYTLLTVFYTMVLFFAGITTTLKSDKIRTAFLGLGTLLFVYTLYLTFRLPMASAESDRLEEHAIEIAVDATMQACIQRSIDNYERVEDYVDLIFEKVYEQGYNKKEVYKTYSSYNEEKNGEKYVAEMAKYVAETYDRELVKAKAYVNAEEPTAE